MFFSASLPLKTELEVILVDISPPRKGKTFQDPRSSSVVFDGVYVKRRDPDIFQNTSSAGVISLALLPQSWYYHNAIHHLSGGGRKAWPSQERHAIDQIIKPLHYLATSRCLIGFNISPCPPELILEVQTLHRWTLV